ncbi:MAG: hypothetical protein MN733_17195 [Nitrososphaera sp.]|nr:hypothetical protein [Nitrososphaera sp.]
MKMALLLAGQARSIDKLPYHSQSILRFISLYWPDVYCSFWEEPEALKALELFKPIKHNLSSEAEYQQDKQEWWDRWARIVSAKTNVEHRRKKYWNEVPASGRSVSRDNTIRHWSRMTAGVHLIKEQYDVLVVTRTDIVFNSDPKVLVPQPMKLYTTCRTGGALMDRFFWGAPDTLIKLLNWERMIKAMAHAELNGKYGRRPMALARDNKWLAPENTLMITMQYAGIENENQLFHTRIIR